MVSLLTLSFSFTFVCFAFGASTINNYEGKEAWGYINVRKDAYMFWWLYYTDATKNYETYPLVIWLQGGPGSSSTGYGNFNEIGPLDVNLNPRNTSWVKKANILFFDNPVGTGYSYVTNTSALTKTNAQIADDLVTALTAVMETAPEFQKSPLFIFGESYGGKMTVDFALALNKAIKSQKITCNFKGVALGDSWISPVDSVSTWGQYLYTMSLLDKGQLQDVNMMVKDIKKTMVSGLYKNATVLQSKLQDKINNYTHSVNWYNILYNEGATSNPTCSLLLKDKNLHNVYKKFVGHFHSDPLDALMNGKIREKLHVIPKNVTWGGLSTAVFEALSEDFMKPVVASVDALLNETLLTVNVYSGQLDLIVDNLGTLQWIERLKWPGVKGFLKSTKKSINFPGDRTGGFSKSFKQFAFFSILKAGHMIPKDAGECALKMLDMILSKST